MNLDDCEKTFYDLSSYLKNIHNITLHNGIVQGYCEINEQITCITDLLLKNKNIKNILNIGFNAGHSAELFLINSKAHVTSIEIENGIHNIKGNEYINSVFENRHKLITGNSKDILPILIKENRKFDLIFIDGDHKYNTVKSDMLNSLKLINSNGYILLDDTVNINELIKHWNIGPNNVLNEFVNKEVVKIICSETYGVGRGMTVLQKLDTHHPCCDS